MRRYTLWLNKGFIFLNSKPPMRRYTLLTIDGYDDYSKPPMRRHTEDILVL